ncbi:UNVERIFIED_CONTAM: hypothetical protein Sradi_0709900 [Sesamum radiatum]|uniref:Uncharacterized protein n=1 Tax=Sesamum radiatum TaxID=300843 RepID=A0AAW2VM38_SESRA
MFDERGMIVVAVGFFDVHKLLFAHQSGNIFWRLMMVWAIYGSCSSVVAVSVIMARRIAKRLDFKLISVGLPSLTHLKELSIDLALVED